MDADSYRAQTPGELATLTTFWASPLEALFDTEDIAVILSRSESSLEQDRAKGIGLPFYRIRGKVLYRKSDVVALIEKSRQEHGHATA